jgi:UDP-N-acetylmuramoylalanine--D-glutamate ligase
MRVAGGSAAVRRVEGLAEAVAAARAMAEAGDVVLLSPACTSYDAYESFERRGEHFRLLVRRMVNPILSTAEGEVQPSLP